MQVIIELLIIDDPVVPLLVVEAEVVLLIMEPLIIKEPVVPLLIVETLVVALLIIEELVVPLITEPAAAGHAGSDTTFWGLQLLGHVPPLGQGLACITAMAS